VWLDVRDTATGLLQRANLLDRLRLDRRRRHVQRAAAEPLAVPVADVRADRHTALDGLGADGTHRRGVTGVEPAGDIRARHEREQVDVPIHALANVCVQIDHPRHAATMPVVSVLRATLRRWLIRAMSKTHLLIHRLSRGRLLGRVAGMPVLLLTTTGRRSGKPRTTPLTFFRDGVDLVVIASNGGADRPPDWSLNLEQNPRAAVKIGTDELTVQTRTASPEERKRLWIGITATYSGYAQYQKKTARQIPVVILTPDRELTSTIMR
jgi:deazaflavin-dependent oxidoreductase (nitroreductase family)